MALANLLSFAAPSACDFDSVVLFAVTEPAFLQAV